MLSLLFLIFFPLRVHADKVKTLRVCENTVAEVAISPHGTVLDFPIEPEKVILGTKGSFHIEYVKSDLALSPSSNQSRSNLFVYLLGRRFVFELKSVANAQTVYFVRDCKDQEVVNKKVSDLSNPNESSVEVLPTEPSIRHQYGKGFVYANNRKHPTWMWVTGLSFSASLIFPLFVGGPPTKQDIEGIETPNLDSLKYNNVNIPFYSSEQAQAENEEHTRKNNARIIVKYSGIQSIDRDLKFEISPGSEVRAKIVGVASQSLVRAELIEDLKVNDKTYFKTGTLFTGLGSTSEDRLQISFNSVTLDKKRISIQAQALDPDDKNVGVRGSRFAYYSKKLGVAVGLNFVAAATDVLQERDSVGLNVVKKSTIENALLSGASQTASDLSKAEMDKVKKGSELIYLAPGTEIIIVF